MSRARRHGAHAAALIAAITVLARLAGFARTAAFGRSVGSGCVGSVYQTANYIPNIVFDIVAGGTLAALVVPILAPALATGDRVRANQLLSAMLSWALVVLVPLAVLIALGAGPLIGLLLGPQSQCPGAHPLGVRLLVVFAPQVVFYGLGVVLGGALSASERFAWPALAPLLSSVVVVGVYLGYGALAGPGRAVAGLPRNAELLLGIGTTVGVVVLAMSLIGPAWRAGFRWRFTLRFPLGVARAVQIAAGAGAVTLAAQELSTAVMVRLGNGAHTVAGTLVVIIMAQTVFQLPWAVLSLPVATAAYPRLAARWEQGDRPAFRRHAGTATTVVIAAAGAGTALLVAVAEPAGIVLLRPGALALAAFAPTVIGFAVGLLGWSLVALLARALYASGQVVAAARAQVVGQLSVIVLDLVLSGVASPADRGLVLGLGNSIGCTLAAALLLRTAYRVGALDLNRALARSLGASAGAALVAAAVGWSIGRQAHGRGTAPSLAVGLLAAVVSVIVFVPVLALCDRALFEQLRSRLPRRRSST